MIRSFGQLLRRCYHLVRPYGRGKLLAVLGLSVISGFIQLLGVGSVFPFFAIAANPDKILTLAWLQPWLQKNPGFTPQKILIFTGCFAILMLVLSNLFGLLNEFYRFRYAYGFCHWLRNRMLAAYSRQPYAYFLNRNSSQLALKLWEINSFISGLLLPLGEVLSKTLLVTFVIGGLLFLEPWISASAILVLGGVYGLLFLILQDRLKRFSQGMNESYYQFGKKAAEFLQGIKTVMAFNAGPLFVEQALTNSRQMSYYGARVPLFSGGPRFLIEPLAFGGLVAVVVTMAWRGREFQDLLPSLSVLALAGYRILPAVQAIYGSLVGIRSNLFQLERVEEELGRIGAEPPGAPFTSQEDSTPVRFEKELAVRNLSFRYGPRSPEVLRRFNLTIRKNQWIGIAGVSGSGKSTLVDLLLGLHRPTGGEILVDGNPLQRENLSAWRTKIGYVPQDIFLLDDSVANNIAFGVEPSQINHSRLKEAAQAAQIRSFIEKELPDRYETRVGERGVRLSGGQRQRIGLARALYHRPEILLLDEATSALDHETEEAVMATVRRLHGKMTIVSIAHRSSTLENCDRLVRLGVGKNGEERRRSAGGKR